MIYETLGENWVKIDLNVRLYLYNEYIYKWNPAKLN